LRVGIGAGVDEAQWQSQEIDEDTAWGEVAHVGRASFRAGKMGRARGCGAHRQMTYRQNTTDLGTVTLCPDELLKQASWRARRNARLEMVSLCTFCTLSQKHRA
jgi:hypothetical protein